MTETPNELVFGRKVPKLHLIEDGLGNSIEVPKIGSMTPLEYKEHYEIRRTLPEKENMTLLEFDTYIACSLLRHRGWWGITPDQLMEEAPTYQIIHLLADFAKNEFDNWHPKNIVLECFGEDAELIVTDYAEKHPGMVAATREDLKVLNKWVVFRNIEAVPEEYDIVGESQEEAVRPSLPISTASANISTTSTGSVSGNSQDVNNSTPKISGTPPSPLSSQR